MSDMDTGFGDFTVRPINASSSALTCRFGTLFVSKIQDQDSSWRIIVTGMSTSPNDDPLMGFFKYLDIGARYADEIVVFCALDHPIKDFAYLAVETVGMQHQGVGDFSFEIVVPNELVDLCRSRVAEADDEVILETRTKLSDY
jgi:hypothetical protein